MSSGVGAVQLTLSFVRHRRAQTAVLLLIGLVLAAAVMGLAVVRSSAQDAVLDSLRADLGQRHYALQTSNARAIDVLRDMPSASPVQDEQGDVVAGDVSAPVLVRTVVDSSTRLGVLVSGARPSRAGDVVLTQATADALNVSVGDRVEVSLDHDATPVRVVGLSVDPADSSNSTLVRLVRDDGTFTASRWLSDEDFYNRARLRPFLDRRTASYQSLDTLLENARANRPQFLSAMRFLPAGAGLLLAVLLVSVVATMSRRWRQYAEGLVGAGMSRSAAWRRLFGIAFVIVLVGELAGGLMATGLLALCRRGVSGWFGQHWVTVTVPVLEPVAIVGLTVLAAMLAVPAVRVAPGWTSWFAARRRQRRWATPLAGAVAAVSIVGWVLVILTADRPGGDRAVALAPLFALLVVATLPFLLAPVAGLGLPAATHALLRHLTAGLRPVAAVAATVAVTCGVWAAQTTHDANVGEAMSSPLEPAGSFVISGMPNSAISTLSALYAGQGGRQLIRYGIPDESSVNLRATSTGLVTCLSQRRTLDPSRLPDACFPQKAASPINTVMIGAAGSTPKADPRLLEGGKKVGLLLFDADQPAASKLADTSAEPDPTLGGNLPGLVVPADSNVLDAFALRPSGTSAVLLLDFDRLTPRQQVFVRAATLRLAPGAQTADGTDPTAYDRLRSVANTVSILGAVAAAIVLLLGGVSMAVAHSLTRRTLVDLGSAPGPRRRLLARLTAVLVAAGAATVPLAILTASLAGQSADAAYGRLWVLPGAAAVLSAVAVGVAFARTPERGGE